MLKKITKIALIFLGIAVTVILMAAGIFFAARLMLTIDAQGATSSTQKIEDSVKEDNKSGEQERLNFLIMGKDKSSGLCDVIMLASYNITDSSVGVIQIPRDTYAEFTDGSYKKLNGAVSALGGERAFCDFLSEALSVRIDHYVSLDLDAVGEIVDELGGIEVNVPCDMDYEDAVQGLYIHIKKGKNILDGDMAEQFVRFRSSYLEGDIGRIDAQKIFLAALFQKLRNDTSVFELGALAAKIADDVKTSFSIQDMLVLAKRALSVSSEKISFATIAGEGAVATKSGASYYVISRPSAIEMINEVLGENIKEDEFDRDSVFLNENYKEFKRIYSSKAEYKIYSASQLSENGIDIAHK